MRHCLYGLLASALCHCGPAQTPDPALPANDLTMQDLRLDMYRFAPTDDAGQKPLFSVEAREGAKAADKNLWSLTGIRAVVNGDQGPVTMEAGEAIFDEDEQIARLSGGVKVQSGAIFVETDQIQWDNTQETIRADSPLLMTDGAAHLRAGGLTFDPNTRTFTLTRVNGRYPLEDKAS